MMVHSWILFLWMEKNISVFSFFRYFHLFEVIVLLVLYIYIYIYSYTKEKQQRHRLMKMDEERLEVHKVDKPRNHVSLISNWLIFREAKQPFIRTEINRYKFDQLKC